MHGSQRRSHRLVTYGRPPRNKALRFVNYSREDSALHTNSDEQGTPDTFPNSGFPEQQQPRKIKTKETETQLTGSSSKQSDSSREPSFFDEYTCRFRSSMKDEPGDECAIKRKRQKFSPDYQGSNSPEMNVDDGCSPSITGSMYSRGENSVTRSDHIKTRSRNHMDQCEKWDGKHMVPDSSLRSQSSMLSGHGEIAYPRKKLVDLLDSTHQTAEGPSASSTSGSSKNVARTSPTRKRDMMPQRVEDSVSAPSSGLRSSTVTYARQRSFLNEACVSSGIEDKDANTYSKQQLTESKKTPCFDLDVDDETSAGSGPIRNIHELRQAGDNARFRSAVDCILEDIANGDNSDSTRCNGFVQLSSKLLDRGFTNRFSECGFTERLVECVTNDLDIISASFAFCSFELILSCGAFPQTHLASLWSSLLDLSPRLLDVEDDILFLSKTRGSGVSRAVQKSIQEIVPMMSSVNIGDQLSPMLSPRFLALQCIWSVLLRIRQHNIAIKTIPTAILDRFVHLLISKHYQSKAGSLLSTEDCRMVITTLSILEAYTILLGPLSVDHQNALKSLTQLSNFLDPKGLNGSDDCAQQIHVHYIRVILNLTNSDPSFCDGFVTHGLVGGLINIIISGFCVSPERSPVEERGTLNTIILALGTLINLTEKSDLARAMFLTQEDESTSSIHLLVQKFSANINLVTEV